MKRLLNVFWVCIISLCILSLSCVIASATNNQSIDTEDAFQDGWQEGYDIGSDEGYSKGYDEGYNDGLEESIYKYNSDTYDEDSNENYNLNKEDLIIILALIIVTLILLIINFYIQKPVLWVFVFIIGFSAIVFINSFNHDFSIYLLFYLIIAIIVLADKYTYMKSEYDLVEHCCCFAPVNNLYSNEISEFVHKICILNELLKESPFLIFEDETTAFVEIYKKYRIWLLQRYMDKSFKVKYKYDDLFSISKKKYYNISAIEELYGGNARNNVFFAKSFCDFCKTSFDVQGDTLVAYKMYLGAAKILKVIGYDKWLADDLETKIINLLHDNEKNEN